MKTFRFRYLLLLFSFIAAFFIISCQQDITLSLPKGPVQLVVEGYIEPGLPPYVILTQTVPYFGNTSLSDVSNSFVKGALILITDGVTSDTLKPIQLNNLPESLKKQIGYMFQIDVDSVNLAGVNFLFYSTFNTKLFGQTGKTYSIVIKALKQTLTAHTTIPPVVVPDSFWFEPHGNANNDSIVALYCKFRDPSSQPDYYRYFTKRNNETYYPPSGESVFTDQLALGDTIIRKLSRGRGVNSGPALGLGSNFKRGDTIRVKFCTIDYNSYQFWNTFEHSQYASSGFSNPVLIQSNISGGLGIWCGYGSYYRKIIAPLL